MMRTRRRWPGNLRAVSDPAAGTAAQVAVAGLVPLLDDPVIVADAGCRWGATSTWSALEPRLGVLAFDADAAECARLEAAQGPGGNVRYVPTALGAVDGVATLHVAREPACSSIFPPDPLAVRERPELAIIQTVRSVEVPVARLDTWAAANGGPRVDAMKLDVQGAELEVLRGAGALLSGMRVLELEVTFTPIYAGQALFADIDAFLRAEGFSLWRLGHLVHYGRAGDARIAGAVDPTFYDGRQVDAPTYGGQLYWGHALYVAGDIAARTPSRWQQKVRDAAVCGAAGLHDLARGCLIDALATDMPPDAAATVHAVLQTKP